MKELFILDEDDTHGVAYTSHGDIVRGLDRNWRRATRREWLWFQLRQPRLSILGFCYGVVVYFIIVVVLDWLR